MAGVSRRFVERYWSGANLRSFPKLRQFRGETFLLLISLCCSLFASGCVSPMELSWIAKKEFLPLPHVSQIVTTWESQVLSAPDTVHHGKATPCLAGRMYLFGPDFGYPVKGDGQVTVQLLLPQPGEQPSVLLEQWNIDGKTLYEKLGRKDFIGWGYTLILPWGSYHPAIDDVELLISYTPKNGAPIYTRAGMHLMHKKRPFTIREELQPVLPPNQPPANAVPNRPPTAHIPLPNPASRHWQEWQQWQQQKQRQQQQKQQKGFFIPPQPRIAPNSGGVPAPQPGVVPNPAVPAPQPGVDQHQGRFTIPRVPAPANTNPMPSPQETPGTLPFPRELPAIPPVPQ